MIDPLEDGISSVALIDSMGDDQRIVDAARVSIAGYKVKPVRSNERLIRYLFKNRHTTPLEQVRFTFYVRLPIFCARQWIRHRTGSFNEESARYGQLESDFYFPSLERLTKGGQSKDNKQASGESLSTEEAESFRKQIKAQTLDSYYLYEYLLANGLARELARVVLPVNIYTRWYWTTDLHNLMHFLRLRLHPHSQWEMQKYAEAVLELAKPVAPIAFQVFEESL